MAEYRIPVEEFFSWQKPVIEIRDAPGTTTKGNRYIVGTSPSGLWIGHANEIAWYDGSAWQFDTPAEGWQVYDANQNLFLYWSGSAWTQPTGAVDEKVKADSSDPSAGYLDAKVDDSTIEVNATAHQLRVKDGGITEAKLANTFIRADGTNDFTADQSMGGFKLTTLAAPTDPNDAARKIDVDNAISGLNFQENVLNTQVDATLDPGTPTIGDRYIITDSSNLHANFGTITGIGDDDIVEWTGSAFEVAYDASVEGEGAITFDEANNTFMRLTDDPAWVEFGGLNATVAGTGLTYSGNILNVVDDGSTLQANADSIQIRDGGVGTTQLALDSVDKTIINADIAGSGLTQAAGGELDIDYDTVNFEITGSGLGIKDGGVTAVDLNADVVGAGMQLNGTTNALEIDFDGSFFEIVTNELTISDASIGTTQLAADSVDKTIINADIAGLGLVQAAGGELDVQVDGTTIEIVTDTLQVESTKASNWDTAYDRRAQWDSDLEAIIFDIT